MLKALKNQLTTAEITKKTSQIKQRLNEASILIDKEISNLQNDDYKSAILLDDYKRQVDQMQEAVSRIDNEKSINTRVYHNTINSFAEQNLQSKDLRIAQSQTTLQSGIHNGSVEQAESIKNRKLLDRKEKDVQPAAEKIKRQQASVNIEDAMEKGRREEDEAKEIARKSAAYLNSMTPLKESERYQICLDLSGEKPSLKRKINASGTWMLPFEQPEVHQLNKLRFNDSDDLIFDFGQDTKTLKNCKKSAAKSKKVQKTIKITKDNSLSGEPINCSYKNIKLEFKPVEHCEKFKVKEADVYIDTVQCCGKYYIVVRKNIDKESSTIGLIEVKKDMSDNYSYCEYMLTNYEKIED